MKYTKYLKVYDGRYMLGYQETVLKVDENNIITKSPIWMNPDLIIPVLVRELSLLGRKSSFQRICPYRFIEREGDIYIQFAEQKAFGDFKLNEKRVIRKSNSGNFKIAKEAFLYDVLDYFVSLGLLTDSYTLTVKALSQVIKYEISDIIDEDFLKENGFKFPYVTGLNE